VLGDTKVPAAAANGSILMSVTPLLELYPIGHKSGHGATGPLPPLTQNCRLDCWGVGKLIPDEETDEKVLLSAHVGVTATAIGLQHRINQISRVSAATGPRWTTIGWTAGYIDLYNTTVLQCYVK
jgi:hypothetical protein